MIIHFAARPGVFHRCFKAGMDLGIFVFILDLIAALFDAFVDICFASSFRLVATPTDGEKEDWLGAAVEMLMKPHFRRHEHAPRSPIDALFGFAFLPHERVAMPSDDQDMDARSVTMRFLICPDAPERDV